MSYKTPNHIDLHEQVIPGVWIYNNFINDIDLIVKKCSDEFTQPGFYETDVIEEYGAILSEITKSKNVFPVQIRNLVYRSVGQDVAVHTDVVNVECAIRDIEVDEYSDVKKVDKDMAYLSYIVYINDNYEGGEIFYPEYDFVYKPKAGDLVVHDVNIVHGVSRITSGNRITFTGQINKKYYLDANKMFEIESSSSQEIWRRDDQPRKIAKDDPRYFFQEGDPVIKHPRLKKYIESKNKAVD
jgi:hypothetical protein